jgi:glycolate oxidase
VLVRLTPKPALARCLLASFDDMARAGDAVATLIASGLTPAGLEMMDAPMTAAVEDFVHAGYDLDAAAILLCEADGTPESVEAELAQMRELLLACGATRIEVSRDEAERLRFWSGRKNAFPASGRISPDYLCMDASIPRRRLAEMLKAIEAMQAEWRLRCMNVFHAGDGNLHPLILFDAKEPDQLRRAEGFGAADPRAGGAHGRVHHRRAWRRRRETGRHVPAVQRRGAGQLPRREARLGPRAAPQPRQGHPAAAPLRRGRPAVGARRRAAAPGN